MDQAARWQSQAGASRPVHLTDESEWAGGWRQKPLEDFRFRSGLLDGKQPHLPTVSTTILLFRRSSWRKQSHQGWISSVTTPSLFTPSHLHLHFLPQMGGFGNSPFPRFIPHPSPHRSPSAGSFSNCLLTNHVHSFSLLILGGGVEDRTLRKWSGGKTHGGGGDKGLFGFCKAFQRMK